jgi:ankyrin repeat protein
MSSSENSEFKQTSAYKQGVTSEDIEEEPELEPQDLLIWALEQNKFERFSSLLEVPEVDPRFKYGKPHYTTCMELACRLHWGGKFVRDLLEHGVKPNIQEIHPEPIHYAAKYGNPEALEALLQYKKTKVNVVDSSGRTALHHAVSYSKKGRDTEYERCIELLLKRPDLALNIANTSGYTAVHEAANSKKKKAVELILKYRKDDVDLDSYSTRGRTARECILSNYPELRKLLPEYRIKNQSLDHNSQLLIALQNRQLKTFHYILCLVDEDGKARVDPNYYYGRPHFATCLEIACWEKDCVEFVKELLHAGADPNFVNPTTKKTALQVSVDMRNIYVLSALLEDRRTNINALHDELQQVIADLHQQRDTEDTMQDNEEAKQYKDAMQELKRVLHTRMSEILITDPGHKNIDKSQSGQILFQHLYEGNYKDFKNNFREENKDTENENYTLLQYATLHSLEDVVQLLLEHGADPNATTKFEKRAPILIACMNNNHEIMKLLLTSATNNQMDVNVTDAKGNTPLHYASNTKHLDCVVDLMRCGANIKHKNIFNKSPLPANSVEKFLDMSLQTNNKFPVDEEHEIIFDYSFLVAHKEKGTQPSLPQESEQHLIKDHETGSRNVRLPEKLKPEMDFLFYMSQSDEHRKLMQHPIITSFLHMKWQRVKFYFYINICIYFLFAVLLNAYILLKIEHATNGSESMITSYDTKTSQSHLTNTGFHAAWISILFLLLYFTVRELLQLALSPKLYFTMYENILDLSIIFFSSHILFSSEWQESFVVITIILSWTELILLTGRLPKLSKNIEMLKTVCLNYFWFLLSYILLLIAFAFSFYSFTLLQKNATNSSTKHHDREDQYFFMNPYMSVMKTFVMMMGEFQAESLAPEMANSPTYFCLFALFVFIIAMVLLNLLTGLAVSDTHAIKSKSEQLSLVSRIRVIYEIESTLLQWYTFVGKWPKHIFLRPFTNCLKSRIKTISLFPDTSNKKIISVLPNKGPNIVFESNGLNEGEDVQVMKANGGSSSRHPHILNLLSNNNHGQNTSCKMTSIIIGEATHIISKRSECDVNNMKENFSQIQEALKENESKLSKIGNKMEELFENYQKKLDGIARKLEHDKIQSKNKGSKKMKLNAATSHDM